MARGTRQAARVQRVIRDYHAEIAIALGKAVDHGTPSSHLLSRSLGLVLGLLCGQPSVCLPLGCCEQLGSLFTACCI